MRSAISHVYAMPCIPEQSQGDLQGDLLQSEEFRYRMWVDMVRFAQSHLTTCDCDWFCPLLISVQTDLVSVFNFICFNVLQLIIP